MVSVSDSVPKTPSHRTVAPEMVMQVGVGSKSQLLELNLEQKGTMVAGPDLENLAKIVHNRACEDKLGSALNSLTRRILCKAPP